eukprot:jgi/Orpsp1_1/1183889/evm.model.c7180000087126.1
MNINNNNYKFYPAIFADNLYYIFNFKNNVNKRIKLGKGNIKNLNIFYVNAQGFNKEKQDITFDSLINIYDIIFIGESWYLDFYKIIKIPSFVASTPLPIRRNNTRPGNGIYCFANPLIKNLIKVLHIDNYSITIKIFDKVIMAVYYPPSLERYKLEKSLTNIYPPDVIFGDFNIDIYSFQDPKKKLLTLSIYLQKYLLKFVNPTLKNNYSKIPKWDHVFGKESLNTKVYVGVAPFYSDHQALEIKFKLEQSFNLSDIRNTKDYIKPKYNLTSLKDSIVRT